MFKLPRRFLLILVGCCALPLGADAVLLNINNSSFESPTAGSAQFVGGTTTGPTNWTVYNMGVTSTNRYFGVWNPATTASYLDPVPSGTNIGVVFLDDATGNEAGLQQTLAATLQISTQYTLTVSVGNFAPSMGDPWDFTGFPGYRVDLLAGSVVLNSDNNTLAPGEGRFLLSTVTFTTGLSHANAGESLGIRLVNLNGPGVEVNFDQVQLDATAVPEPSSAVLVAFAGWLALQARRSIGKRRKRLPP